MVKLLIAQCNPYPTNLTRFTFIQGGPSNPGHNRFDTIRQRQSFKSALHASRDAKSNDHAIINGEFYETNRVFLQKSLLTGVGYFAYGFPKTPIFVRTQAELNSRYVVFQDPYLPPGEGYFVVMKKIPSKATYPSMSAFSSSRNSMLSEIPYEGFHLLLGNNIQGSISRLNVERLAYDIRTNFYTKQRDRMRWMGKRQRAHLYGRRFMMGGQGGMVGMKPNGWRGRRSIHQDYNTSVLLKGSINTSCRLGPLNVTFERLKIRDIKQMRTIQTHSRIVTNIKDVKVDRFQVFM
ncbi:unnamed protein product [Orchesella dallaii]|uniref:Uncharacterized protein n=1 Tax=Orchesella dallaii TaxID=48710 RepID=A0ABP1QR87_9HEXA